MMTIYGVLMAIIIFFCILLILVVLSQNPKGGGLSPIWGGSGSQMFGVQKTNDFMDKATWTLGAAIVILSIFASIVVAKPNVYSPEKSVQTEQSAANK